ncbi:SDR family NAD(P)-dependent oxidoreductase [Leucobacter sp. GX24907]
MRMQDKVAVLTAAASGMGLATSKLMAKEGAKVVLADINERDGEQAAADIRAAGGEAIFVRTDVSSENDVEQLVARAIAEFGRIDVLFNGVGINMAKPITECTVDDFDAVMTLNLRSVFLTCKHVLPHMLENENGGAIVNNSSVAGLVGRPSDPLYGASKHGINGLTKALALNYADQKIRVNSVCPGSIGTPLFYKDVAPGESKEEFKKRVVASSPTPRVADAEEVANAVLFLASDESSFVSGVALAVDGAKAAGLMRSDRFSMDFDLQ